MLDVNVVRCSSVDHKLHCLNEAIEAVRRAKFGNEMRNGRKVTIRGAITDPCGCHLDALIWLASDMAHTFQDGAALFAASTMEAYGRMSRGDMH